MKQSDQLADLADALSKAQANISGAAKDALNPHFKSAYADLASVWEACRKPLTDNGLSVVQTLSSIDNKVVCTTMLLHKSGQFISGEFSMTPQQNTPQAAGSCATYLRRYSLQAIVGVAPHDDDGNEASNSPKPQARTPEPAATGRAVASHDQKTVVEAPRKAPEVQPESVFVATIFSKAKTEHVQGVVRFLDTVKGTKHLVAMCQYLEGKPYTKDAVVEAWQRINPEAPDKEPE